MKPSFAETPKSALLEESRIGAGLSTTMRSESTLKATHGRLSGQTDKLEKLKRTYNVNLGRRSPTVVTHMLSPGFKAPPRVPYSKFLTHGY